jgi:hypothetical protein
METLKLKVLIPETLNDIKLIQYQKFLESIKNRDDDKFIKNKFIEYSCGIDTKNIISINEIDSNRIYNKLNQLFEYKKPVFKQEFILGNITFGFIPNLEKLTITEYQIIEDNIANIETIHLALAVLYRPIIKKNKTYLKRITPNKYLIDEYREGELSYSEVLKHMPLDLVYGTIEYFIILFNDMMKKNLNNNDSLLTLDLLLINKNIKGNFIDTILTLLRSDDYLNYSETIEIAKGKYEIVKGFKNNNKQLKRYINGTTRRA